MTTSELVGTQVSIPGASSGYGIIKYIGDIQSKVGIFVGIELTGSLAINRGKNSGSVNGIEYFKVKLPGSGLFLPYDRLKSVNPSLPENPDVLKLASPRVVSLNETLERRKLTPDMILESRQSTPFRRNSPDISSERAKYEAEIANLKKIIQDQDKRLEQFNTQRQEWRAAMDELVSLQQDGIEVFENKVQELENECNSYKREIERLNSELSLSGIPNKESELAQERISQLEQQIESLLSTRVNNVDINNDDLHKQVQDLKRELESRPKMDNLLNLQKELDELDSIYHQQLDSKNQQIKQLEQEIRKIKRGENTYNSTTDLPIYQAPIVVDPSSGKNDWCGLCERDGHSSINCPYENDIF